MGTRKRRNVLPCVGFTPLDAKVGVPLENKAQTRASTNTVNFMMVRFLRQSSITKLDDQKKANTFSVLLTILDAFRV